MLNHLTYKDEMKSKGNDLMSLRIWIILGEYLKGII